MKRSSLILVIGGALALVAGGVAVARSAPAQIPAGGAQGPASPAPPATGLAALQLRHMLDPVQANAAEIITAEAKRAGANWIPFAQGLIANAWGESRLRPTAIGDNGKSFGLFQLYTGGGLGSEALAQGYSTADLMTPGANARFFVGVCLRTPQVLNAIRAGSAAAVTRAVCIYVERPAMATIKAEERVGYLRTLFAGTD